MYIMKGFLGAYGTNEIFKTKLQMIPQYFVNSCQF